MALAPANILDDNQGGVLIEWDSIDDSTAGGAAVDVGAYDLSAIHSDGNYGSGASVALQGSNNAVAWFALTSDGTNAIALTADTVGSRIWEQPKFIRPLGDAGGDASTDIVVRVFARKRFRH